MSDGKAVLDGIRVLEVATYVFGPAAAMVMADFGAEVIKIEHPEGGDPYRSLYKFIPMPVSEINYCWILEGRNKKSVALNLGHEAGREIVMKLALESDVLVTNFHPSILKKFRLEYEDLAPQCPRLIYAHATGYGEAGEEVEKPGFDATAYWARSGLMDIVRSGENDPSLTPAAMGDHPSSMALFGAIMLALYRREKTGRGTKVSSSLMANGVWANGCAIMAALCGAEFYPRRSRREAFNAMANHYVARDGKRFMLASLRPDDWKNLCRAIGRPELIEDRRFAERETRLKNMTEFIAFLDEAFAKRDRSEWEPLLRTHDVTFSRVATVHEAPNDPQMRANGLFVEIEDPRHGPVRVVDSPIALRDSPKRKPGPAPEVGQHTDEILARLGYSAAAIRELKLSGVVGPA